MARNGNAAGSPISSGIRDFLTFCRIEKGLSKNSLDAYGRDLEGLEQDAGVVRRRPVTLGSARGLPTGGARLLLSHTLAMVGGR